jgi:RNA polymerase sigma-70 factor (ECF subfamily)
MENERLNPREMMRAAREGDREALSCLLEHYRNLLLLLTQTSLDGAVQAKAGASDVVQETLLKANQRFEQFRGSTEGELVSWLKQILARNLIDVNRRFLDARQAGGEQSLEAILEKSSHALGRLLPATGSSPSEGAARRERAVLLADALARLAPDDREVIVLRSLRELEWSEVGRRMRRAPDAARMLWTRALRELGRLLAGAE